MTKNIIIVLLVLVTIFFAVLSNMRKQEADRFKEEAKANLQLAKIQETKAKEMESIASQKAAEARIAVREAEEAAVALMECQGK